MPTTLAPNNIPDDVERLAEGRGAWANDEYRVPASDSGPGGADGGDALGAGGQG